VTGLPVRADLAHADPTPALTGYGLDSNLPILVVSGGSGGAQTLNRAVLEALPVLAGMNIQVVHPTGRTHFDAAAQEAGARYGFYHPTAYVDDMPSLLAAATLMVCRGGSSTLAEVTAAGLPAIVVPYPFAVADHQAHNARALETAAAAVMVPDAEFNGERLVKEIRALLENRDRLEKMQTASRAQGKPEAARKVADLLRDVARKPTRSVAREPRVNAQARD
jgi:UDP-N-acetylglucosamine--N-acetylmuramyl-(pentapeptide) pyrophosphoryl-undecaprenol N-acetylglucosamine transferase